MSNGTRIDPEEREPRAIKIRQPKHTGRKILISALAVLSAFVIIGAGVFAYINFGDYFEFDKFGKTAEGSLGSESEISEDSEPEEPVVPEEPESVPETPSEPEVPEEPEIEEPVEVEPVVEEDPIPRDEWFMLLVNRENPLPEDFLLGGAAIDESGHIVDERIYADLSEMISAGKSEGLKFTIYTAYRTYAKQKELFEAGKTDVPAGASEHNSGLAVDIGCLYGEFEGSPEETWLLAHAHEFGFILRYPEGKEDITGFAHEPWHFRYVGKEQAKLIFESGLCLEEYLAQ